MPVLVSMPARFALVCALICGFVPMFVGCARTDEGLTGTVNGRFSLRSVSDEACTGCRMLRYNDLDVYLKPMPVATARDVERVRKAFDSATAMPTIQVTFKSEAAQRIFRATAERQGEQLAWVVDDAIISVATVLGPFGREMQVSGIDAAETTRMFTLMTTTESSRRPGDDRRRPK